MRERPSVNLTEQLPDIIQHPITAIIKTERQPRLLRRSPPQAMRGLRPLAATTAQLAMLLIFAMAKVAAATASEAVVAAVVLATADVGADADPADYSASVC